MNNKVLVLTNKYKRGGSIYENSIAEVLASDYNVEKFLFSSERYSLLPGKKIRFFMQLLSKKIDFDTTVISNVTGYNAGILGKPSRKKILVIHHIDFNKEVTNFFDRILLKKLLNNDINRFDYIVTVANYWKNILQNYVEEEKIKVIYNSFNIEFIKKIIKNTDIKNFKKKYSLPMNKIIVYGGNSVKVKGIVNLQMLLKENKKFFLVTSGAKDIEGGNLHLNLSYEDYIRLLYVSDVTVILSQLNEGWNRIAHESILCGTPVIGNDIGGLGELLKLCGQLIFNSGKTFDEQYEEAIASDVLRSQKLLSKFDIEYFGRQWKKLI